MNESHLERRVGLFILIGLVLLAALLLLFSKGTTFYQQTYGLRLKSANVGGIKTGANVLVSGVPVGRVSGVDLALDGKSVTINLKIFQRYKIYEDARFEIEQFGFLGDQYISIYPEKNVGRQLKDGDEVACRTPFNMQEAVSKATDTISKIGQAATNLNEAVSDVRKFVLTERTLTNLAGTLDKFAGTNALPISTAISNVNYFAKQLTPLAENANELVASNKAEVTAAIKNIETASGMLTNLLGELQTGDGLAGRLLRDGPLAANFSLVASNLAITSSNLNRLGLWGILWKPKTPKTNAVTPPGHPGRTPFS